MVFHSLINIYNKVVFTDTFGVNKVVCFSTSEHKIKEVTMAQDGQSIESTFLTMVSMIASKHGCAIDDIDIENRVINISCSNKKDEAPCAMEIAEAFDGYAV